jgi:hypothetical protein
MGSAATRRPDRKTLIALSVVLGVALVFALVGLRSRSDKPKVAAWVDGNAITALQVSDLVDHARAEAGREGNPVPQPGSDEYKALQQQALALLVYHEELEQAGAALGVRVTDAELKRRANAGGSGESDAGSDQTLEFAFRKEGIRGALLYRRIYARITRTIRVTPREVRTYYDDHATLFRAQGRSLAAARRSIASDLRATKGNAAMARWVSQMKRSYASKVRYAAGFAPQ